jgi:hypothetical protein
MTEIRMIFAGLVALLACAGCSTTKMSSRPDLTGIWTMQADGKGGSALNGPGDFEKTAPFTPLAREKLAEYHRLVDATGDTPGAHCVPHGMPLAVFLGGGYPVEFVQRPEQLTIVYETHNEVRRVFLDGRKIDAADILPSRGGVSYGHFEGQTLVIETVGMKESVDQPTAHSADAKIIERYTPNNRGGRRRLKVEVVIDDPLFYTTSPTLVREYTELEDGRMLDYACTEPSWDQHLEKLRAEMKPGGG